MIAFGFIIFQLVDTDHIDKVGRKHNQSPTELFRKLYYFLLFQRLTEGGSMIFEIVSSHLISQSNSWNRESPNEAGRLTRTSDLLPEPVPHHTDAPPPHHHQEESHEPADDVDDGHGGGDTPAGENVLVCSVADLLYPVETFLSVPDDVGELVEPPFTPSCRRRSVRLA